MTIATTSMAAITQDKYGGVDVLQQGDVLVPSPGRGEVRVRVAAASINRGDIHLMEGLPLMLRLFMGLRAPRQRTRGMDVSGVIDAVGEGVTSLRVGDEVFGVAKGSFAEYALADPKKLAIKPDAVSFEDAAAVAVAGCAALRGLRDSGRLAAGARVLVLGASGGVGSFAVQIAKAMGAHVTGVCRTAKIAAVETFGADAVLDYTTQRLGDAGETWDLILDAGGHRSLDELRGVLAPRGTLVIVGSETDGALLGGFDRTLRAGLLSPFVPQRLVGLTSVETSADLEELAQLMQEGALRPRIDRMLPLTETAAGIRLVQEGLITGKVVIAVG
ncbi:NAD(P)-dependent alcohol dehydrogenase [Salinibacterium sp. SYSU T00001]|uniref:NAD(P)-dependent alcohol dehydrogenase n=1 Tax=Homoserinimonas sedimenticola TaxID=2986805 RepID=UPI002235A781|nr:NAD(P)-dependent alcohol dehydrogenase [Salinibacterium sedimenticola]MCW4384798.1 NAD(P)-dependent alcohol dehydrogenase [Salinibacterium sedimenticola]